MTDSHIGTIGWRDLTVDNADEVRDFYSKVVGWTHEAVCMGDYDDYSMVASNGETVAGVCHARGGNAGLPAQWLMYVTVADLDASLVESEANGGRVVSGPHTMGSDRYCVIADPAGASIALYQKGG